MCFRACVHVHVLVRARHLEEGHLVDGGEVVHADDVLRPLGARGNVLDGQGGRVAGNDAVRRHKVLQTRNHLHPTHGERESVCEHIRDRERERVRHIYRPASRSHQRTQRHTNAHNGIEMDTQTGRHTDTQTHRQADRQADRQTAAQRRLWRTLCLTARSSYTASMTMSARARWALPKGSASVTPIRRDMMTSRSWVDSDRFLALRFRLSYTCCSPRASDLPSRSCTLYPRQLHVCVRGLLCVCVRVHTCVYC
jgi:hypothetical protein